MDRPTEIVSFSFKIIALIVFPIGSLGQATFTFWWESGWLFLLIALIIGGSIALFVRNMLRQAHMQQEMALKQRESDQLKSLDELRTRFYSNITHEFRTPLTLILLTTEKIIQDTGQSPLVRKDLAAVHRNARQLLRLINQLLDLSKLESGTMNISLARGNFKSFILDIFDTFLNQAREKGVSLRHSLHLDETERLFDEEKIEKILDNLLTNALKFTEAGGEVSLEARYLPSPSTSVEIKIRDSGLGIVAEKLPHIFERFFQVDNTRIRRFEGTGIGLSLVKELTDLMGGSIDVESEPGRGTQFRLNLHLPKSDANSGQAPISNSSNKSPAGIINTATEAVLPAHDGTKPLLLLVEDHDDFREYLARTLSPEFRVASATNGAQGWDICQLEIPDLVISDVIMPYMDGYELCRRIKSDNTTNHIGVILLTVRTSHDKKIEGLTHGADDYLTKPFQVDELLLRIRNLLAQKQRLREYYYWQYGGSEVALDRITKTDDFVQTIHTLLESQLDNDSFGVKELAKELGMSRRTLHRKLLSTTQLSPGELIRNYRLKRAGFLLREGNTPTETAYLVGFKSPSYFATAFKDFFGKTPMEYASS